MSIKRIIPQLRTTNIASSVDFYTRNLGFSIAFNYQDFYVGIQAGDQLIHLKHVEEQDPSVPYVNKGEHLHLYFEVDGIVELAARLKEYGVPLIKDVHETPWDTREIVIHDDQGHTLYFGEQL